MACGGGCGCNDCGAERSVVTTCAPEPGCRVPGDAVASLPQHPAGGVKPRERSGSRTPPGGVTERVAGEVRGSLTPPQAQPAREAPGPRGAEQARVPAGEPGPQRPAESPDLDPAAESPEADVFAASPEGQPAARSPGEASLDHARRELPGVDLGPSQKRGKGGGGAGTAGSGGGAPLQPPQQGPNLPAPNPPEHDPLCDPCKCVCIPPFPPPQQPEGTAPGPGLDEPGEPTDGVPRPLVAPRSWPTMPLPRPESPVGPIAPDLSGQGGSAWAILQPPQLASEPRSSGPPPIEAQAVGDWATTATDARSAVRAVEDRGLWIQEMCLLGVEPARPTDGRGSVSLQAPAGATSLPPGTAGAHSIAEGVLDALRAERAAWQPATLKTGTSAERAGRRVGDDVVRRRLA